jgi:uncharacterized membrane protein YdbT with pleckstrin-like domain
VRAYLEPGEEVVLEARPHGVALVRPVGRAVIVAGAGAACVVLGASVHWVLAAAGAACLAVGALLALSAVWRWDRTAVVLTTQKLFVVYGILRRRAAAVRLERVPAVEVDQGLLGRLLGYGTLVAGNLEIPHVPRARDVVQRLG